MLLQPLEGTQESLLITKRWKTRRLISKIAIVVSLYILFVLTSTQDKQLALKASQYGRQDLRPRLLDSQDELLRAPLAWAKLARALALSRPMGGLLLERTKDAAVNPDVSIESGKNIAAVDLLRMSDASVSHAQKSHAKFVQLLQNGTANMMPYKMGTKGIVITASKEQLPEILLSIRLLRRTGSKLPVDVFLQFEADKDDLFCRLTLYRLNARCRSLEEFTKGAPMPRGINSRKPRKIGIREPIFKLLAIFASDFEEVIYLDSSTLVFNNPISILKAEPFLSAGLIMWPDFWSASPSKLLLQIQTGADAPLHPNAAHKILTSKGQKRNVKLTQLAISKRLHGNSLLLAIYYGFYGPSLYDEMIQQGTYGTRGDSSILTAANFLGKRHYMVTRLAEAAGYPNEDLDGHPFKLTAMVFYSPVDNFHKRRSDWHLPYFVSSMGFQADARDIHTRQLATFQSSTGETRPHRIWEWFNGRHLPNGWGVKDPEEALWQELTNVVCHANLTFSSKVFSDVDRLCQSTRKHLTMMWPSKRNEQTI